MVESWLAFFNMIDPRKKNLMLAIKERALAPSDKVRRKRQHPI